MEQAESTDAAAVFIAALSSPPETIAATLGPSLAEDATVTGLGTSVTGRQVAAEALANPLLQAAVSGAEWSTPVATDGLLSVRAEAAAGRRVAGIVASLSLDGAGRISSIALEVVPAPPPSPVTLTITDSMRNAVNGALANGTPTVVSYVDEQGVPHLSLRGSTHVHGDRQLALWNRDPSGGMSRALHTNPNVALFYRDAAKRTTYTFTGRGRVVTDPDVTEAVYQGAAAPERHMDPMRRGVAVIVDLDRIEGAEGGSRFVMLA